MIAALVRLWQLLYSRIAERKVREAGVEPPPKNVADVEKHAGAKQGNGLVLATKPDFPQELPTPSNPPGPAPLQRVKGS